MPAFACKKKVNKRDSSIGTWPARVFSASGCSCVTYTPIALMSYSWASALLSSSQCNTWLKTASHVALEKLEILSELANAHPFNTTDSDVEEPYPPQLELLT